MLAWPLHAVNDENLDLRARWFELQPELFGQHGEDRLGIGGIGGVATHPDHRRHGYASVALTAAIQTLRDREDIQFAVLFCERHNEAFYEARGWHRFIGEVWCEQPDGRVRFEAMAPFVFDLKGGAGGGILDLCGLPW